MDFLDPKKKKAHRIRLIVGYLLIGLGIALVALILIFQSYGYDLDRKNGGIIQNGLVFISTQPQQASAFLNGKQYSNLDGARLVLPSDVYKLELKREGYRDWSRTFSLAGGTIERFLYPFIFPVNLDTQDQKGYAAAPNFATQSPDRKWIMVQQPGQLSNFDVFDAGDPQKAPTTAVVPSSVFTASKTHQLQLVEWSTDNRHLLARHNFDGGFEFVVIDREDPTQSFNVNKLLNRPITELTLRDKKFDQFYVYDAATKKLDTAEQKDPTSKPVLNDVLAYESHGSDMLLYTTAAGATTGKARVMLKDGNGSFTIREITSSPTYLLALAQYDGRWYMAAGSASENRVYVYQNPQDAIKKTPAEPAYPVSVLRVDDPRWIEFSANTQFIAVQGGQNFAVYDAEHDRDFRYTIQSPIDTTNPQVSWMDGHRLMINSGGKMVVFDYDGINLQTLVGNVPGITPFFDRDYKVLYNVGPSVSAGSQPFSLLRTDLRIAK